MAQKGEKKYYAVIGHPVGHSLSPAMQNAAFEACSLNGEYTAIDVAPEDMGAFVARARTSLAGFNITVPNKGAVIPFLDEAEPLAALQGSVNTVINRDGVLYGTSTDGYGLEAALKEAFSLEIRGHSVTFIGCGGVVKALAFHFASAGVKKIFLLNRTFGTAQALCGALQERFPSLECSCAPLGDESSLSGFFGKSDLAVQCTSLGLKESDPPPIRPELLPSGILFFDTIYRRTPLLQYAEEHGIRCANGLGMLLHQGAKSFSLWTGKEAPVEAMRRALYEAFYGNSR
ncbi:MAG: shikimate dehydrogenase [Lentisphaeria bacterium]|nr:shikimate dehydrogenase [Lentisphaeria bacterium]